ncbi:MAG: hypothetical protein IT381_32415 [Deltaproteobacteria bacterium]|nr:hypothetical protein [Deltaproteobacteria bacterium]
MQTLFAISKHAVLASVKTTKGTLVRWIDRFVPAGVDLDTTTRARLFIGVASLVALLSLFRGLSLMLSGFVVHGILVEVLILDIAAALWLLRKKTSLALAVHLLFAPLFALGTGMAYQRGGVGAPVLLGLGLLPGAALLIAGPRTGIVYFLLHVLVIGSFATARATGHVFADTLAPDRKLAVETLGAVLFSSALFGVFSIYERLKGIALTERATAERERLSAEQLTRLVERSRAESLAIITKSLMHEVNSPLTVIDQNLRFCTTSAQRGTRFEDPDVASALADARTSTERIVTILRDLRAFTRIDEADVPVIDLCVTSRTALRILRPNFDRVAFELELPPAPVFVRTNESALLLLLLNLLRHAVRSCSEAPHPKVLVSIQATDGVEPHRLIVSADTTDMPPMRTKRLGEASELVVSERIVEQLGGTLVAGATGSSKVWVELRPA